MYVYMSVRLSVLASFRLCFAQMRSGIGPRETLTRILPQPDQHVRILEGVGQNLQVDRCKQPGVWCRLHGWLAGWLKRRARSASWLASFSSALATAMPSEGAIDTAAANGRLSLQCRTIFAATSTSPGIRRRASTWALCSRRAIGSGSSPFLFVCLVCVCLRFCVVVAAAAAAAAAAASSSSFPLYQP